MSIEVSNALLGTTVLYSSELFVAICKKNLVCTVQQWINLLKPSDHYFVCKDFMGLLMDCSCDMALIILDHPNCRFIDHESVIARVICFGNLKFLSLLLECHVFCNIEYIEFAITYAFNAGRFDILKIINDFGYHLTSSKAKLMD